MHGFRDRERPVAIYIAALFERLGLSEEMEPKTRLIPSGFGQLEAVSSADVELGLPQISEILPAPGVELVGPLPAAIRSYTAFAGGIGSLSSAQEDAKTLLQFFSSADVRATWRKNGFQVP